MTLEALTEGRHATASLATLPAKALRTDRQSAERVAAQRNLRVVAAEARRLSGQLRLPGLLSGIEARSAPTERRGVKRSASASTRASI